MQTLRSTGRACALEHRGPNRCGENIVGLLPGRDVDKGPGFWASEQSSYRGQPIDDRNYLVSGHRTQMVWRATTRIGCVAARCRPQGVLVCNCDPGGNMIGETPY